MGDEKKWCPLSFSASGETVLMRCPEKECAWWDPVFNQCAILTIAGELRRRESFRKPVNDQIKTALADKNKS